MQTLTICKPATHRTARTQNASSEEEEAGGFWEGRRRRWWWWRRWSDGAIDVQSYRIGTVDDIAGIAGGAVEEVGVGEFSGEAEEGVQDDEAIVDADAGAEAGEEVDIKGGSGVKQRGTGNVRHAILARTGSGNVLKKSAAQALAIIASDVEGSKPGIAGVEGAQAGDGREGCHERAGAGERPARDGDRACASRQHAVYLGCAAGLRVTTGTCSCQCAACAHSHRARAGQAPRRSHGVAV